MLVRRPVARAGRPGLYPEAAGRLGITAGVAAVLVGAFIFAADFSTPRLSGRLAEHLKRNQAIFYGAYW